MGSTRVVILLELCSWSVASERSVVKHPLSGGLSGGSIRDPMVPIQLPLKSRISTRTCCCSSTSNELDTMSISFTVRPPSAPHRPSPLANGSHRHGPPSRRMFEEHEGDDEERSSHRGKRKEERVDGFRNGRSHGWVPITVLRADHRREPKEAPMVIPSLPNRDWRQTVQRRTPSYRPEVRRQDGEVVTHERTGDQPQRSGLRYAVKTESTTNGVTVKPEEVTIVNGESSTAAKTEPMTLEQQALAELLAGEQHTETEEERAQREMVIAMREGKDMTEDEAFKRDVDTMPEESTLEDYAAVPVSAFGLAMVRGMGYDPKAASNTIIHEPKLRPQLLGLGATPMDPTIRPTHNRKSVKDKQADRKAKTGRGFNAANLLVKQGREGSSSVTPSGSRLQSPNGSEKRVRDDDYDSGREVKRERSDDYHRDSNGNGYRSREANGDDYRPRDRDKRREDYETEEERAARKARERRDRDREYETEEERARRKERERRERDRRDDRDTYREDRDRR